MEELKVKVVSLGEEIRYIRKRKRKYQRMASTAERANRVLEHEGRPVRHIVASLDEHERELSAELRATHLARAFFRGIPWSKLEKKTRDPMRFRLDRKDEPSKSLEARVLRLAQKFGGPSFHRSRFDAWLFRARADLLEAADVRMCAGYGKVV